MIKLIQSYYEVVKRKVEESEEFYTPLIKKGVYFEVQEKNGIPIGYLAIKYDFGTNTIFIDKVLILRGFRSQGYGSKLLKLLDEIYPASILQLKCFEEKLVTDFYMKNNYKIKDIKFENPKYWLMERNNVID